MACCNGSCASSNFSGTLTAPLDPNPFTLFDIAPFTNPVNGILYVTNTTDDVVTVSVTGDNAVLTPGPTSFPIPVGESQSFTINNADTITLTGTGDGTVSYDLTIVTTLPCPGSSPSNPVAGPPGPQGAQGAQGDPGAGANVLYSDGLAIGAGVPTAITLTPTSITGGTISILSNLTTAYTITFTGGDGFDIVSGSLQNFSAENVGFGSGITAINITPVNAVTIQYTIIWN